MSEITRERLFGFRHAFDDPVTVVLTLTALALFLLAPVLILVATRAANSTSDKRKELWDRYRSWIWLALFILIPDSGRRFLDDPGRGHAKFSLLSGIRPHHRIVSGTNHQSHRGYRYSLYSLLPRWIIGIDSMLPCFR